MLTSNNVGLLDLANVQIASATNLVDSPRHYGCGQYDHEPLPDVSCKEGSTLLDSNGLTLKGHYATHVASDRLIETLAGGLANGIVHFDF